MSDGRREDALHDPSSITGVDAALRGFWALTPLRGGVQGSPKLAHRASFELGWGTPERLKKSPPSLSV